MTFKIDTATINLKIQPSTRFLAILVIALARYCESLTFCVWETIRKQVINVNAVLTFAGLLEDITFAEMLTSSGRTAHFSQLN